jgi:hypothetical protein
MPGMDVSGTFAYRGIPAQIVTLFLDERRIEIEKTGDYIMLVLFSIGMTKGKWGTLLDCLLGFKRAYDENTPLRDALPKLAAAHPDRYGSLGLADLCDDMHDALRTSRMPALLDSAFEALPEAKLTPADAYRRLVRGRTERLPLAATAGRTATVMVVPYPPGIPILMPGESSAQPTGRSLNTSPHSRPSTNASPASSTTSTVSRATPTGTTRSNASRLKRHPRDPTDRTRSSISDQLPSAQERTRPRRRRQVATPRLARGRVRRPLSARLPAR